MGTDKTTNATGGALAIDEDALDALNGAGRTYTGGRFKLDVSTFNVAQPAAGSLTATGNGAAVTSPETRAAP